VHAPFKSFLVFLLFTDERARVCVSNKEFEPAAENEELNEVENTAEDEEDKGEEEKGEEEAEEEAAAEDGEENAEGDA
jgi:hypothetical protein